MKAKNIPNILSIFRIVAAMCFPAVFFILYPNVMPAMLIFAAAGATDVLDGFLARRFNWISDAGKVLDPVADKLMQAMVLICLSVKDIIPLWLTVICILKELAMLCGSAIILRAEHKVVVSRWCGKLAVCVFYAAMFILGIGGQYISSALSTVICAVTLLTALLALAMYFPVFLDFRKKRKSLSDSSEKSADA